MEIRAWITEDDFAPWLVFVEGHVDQKSSGINKNIVFQLYSEFDENISESSMLHFKDAEFGQYLIEANNGSIDLESATFWKLTNNPSNAVKITGYKFNI